MITELKFKKKIKIAYVKRNGLKTSSVGPKYGGHCVITAID